MELLLSFDRSLFSMINGLPHTAFFDSFALTLSGYGYQLVLVGIAFILFIKEERKDHWFIIQIGSAGILAWAIQIVLKTLVMRIRPHEIPGMNIIGNQLTDYSFPSGHATIAFALVAVLSSKEPRYQWIIYGIAVCIALSRVYLGVHYPVDIFVGGLIGYSIGYLVLRFFSIKRYNMRYDKIKRQRTANH